MSLLDDDILEQCEDIGVELARSYVTEFCLRHSTCIDESWKQSYTLFYTDPEQHSVSMPRTLKIELSQPGILFDYSPRIYAKAPEYPILIEDWDQPTLPSYIKFLFPSEPMYTYKHDVGGAVYEGRQYFGKIAIINCHRDLKKYLEESYPGVQIIKLD